MRLCDGSLAQEDDDRTDRPPEVIEVGEFEGGVALRVQLAVALVSHVIAYGFRRVEGAAFLIAPQADIPHTDLLPCGHKPVA